MCKHSPSHKHNHRRLSSYLPARPPVFVSQPARLNNNTTWHRSPCPAPIISTASQDDSLQMFFFFFPHFLFASQTQLSLPARIIIGIMGVMCGVFLKRWEKKSLYPNVLLSCNRAGSLLWERNVHTPLRAEIAVMHQCPFGFPLT